MVEALGTSPRSGMISKATSTCLSRCFVLFHSSLLNNTAHSGRLFSANIQSVNPLGRHSRFRLKASPVLSLTSYWGTRCVLGR